MFKINFQDQQILQDFLSALLHLPSDEIQKIQVKNPYKYGDAVNDKALIMDIDLTLNDNIIINLELQVINYSDWPDRSLTYLCREFDQLYRGHEYKNTKHCIHISILDFTLFPDCPEFYAKYMLLNVNKSYGLDQWAALFKATTWEELKAMTTQNPTFHMMAQKLYTSNADENIRKICQQREYYEIQQRRTQETLDEKNAVIAEKDAQIAKLEALLLQQQTK